MKVFLLFFIFVLSLYAKDESELNMQAWLNHEFGLKPYRTNYLLPFCYANKPYETKKENVVYSDFEVEFQVSLMMQIQHDLLGFGEKYYFSYSQHSFWQLYVQSSPFRETNYNPEAFVIFPIESQYTYFKIKSLKFAYAHISNGQPDTSAVVFDNNTSLGNLSRSVNYLYTTLRIQKKSLILDLKAWYRVPDSPENDDNPDLMRYIGYTSAKMTYFHGKNMFTLMGRVNFSTGKGAVEGTYSYPLIRNYFYAKVFSGYAESLIDYNNYITKVSLGFSFSR